MATAPARIEPPLTQTNRAFWTGGATGQLLISRCRSCRRWTHPPTNACPTCGGSTSPEAASGVGSVFTFTINHHAYNPEVPVPYVIAIVELEEQPGLRFTTNLVECPPDGACIGMPVEVTFASAGEAWAPVFRPRHAKDRDD